MMKHIATLGPIGYFPASGTWASLVALAMIVGLHKVYVSWLFYSIITLAIAIIGIYSVKVCHHQFKRHDPGEIVIDEVLGCFITFLFVPVNMYSAMLGFALFRLFDITKMCGIAWLERQPGVWGVMLDDIGAGIVSNIVLHAVLLILGLT